jgi:hypothetical protein
VNEESIAEVQLIDLSNVCKEFYFIGKRIKQFTNHNGQRRQGCLETFHSFGKLLKFLVVFWQYMVIMDIVKEIVLPIKLNVKSERSNCRILKLFYWMSTSKSYSPSFHGIYKIVTFKHQIFFLLSFHLVKFFSPKSMEIRC